MSKSIVILNPASGSTDEVFRDDVEVALQAHGSEFEIRETTPEDGGGVLAARAIEEGFNHLIACGGDGTIMSVVNGLGGVLEHSTSNDRNSKIKNQKSKIVLSILPGGTANLLAGALGIPSDVKEAVSVAFSGQERAIDLGRCGEHLFALGVGLGLTEKLVSQTSAKEKERLGKLAYVKGMLSEMGTQPTRFSFRLDDKPEQIERGVAIVIANAGQIGGNLHFAPDAKMDDGLLDLCILHRFDGRDVLRMAWKSLLGQLAEDRAVSFYRAKKIEVRSEPPLDCQIDGEVVDVTTPLIAEVLPCALTVRVPRQK